MAENLFKVFFIISYESSFVNKIKYSLSNENGIKNLKTSFTQKIKNDDMKEYILSVLSFDINNLKEENLDEKKNLSKAIINFTIENNNYKEQIEFKRGNYNFIFNFNIENNPSLMLLGQSSQLKLFYESLKEKKDENKDILKALILDSIHFLEKNDEIYFNFFLELLKLCFLNEKINSVLLNFKIENIKLPNYLNPKDYASILSLIEKNPTKFCKENDEEEKEKINEKFYTILLLFIANYENDEKIKLEKIEKLLSDQKKYFIKIIPLYIQYYSNIIIPEDYARDIFMKVNLTYEIIKGILNCIPLNIKKLEIINQCRDSICEFCKNNDKKLNMIELAPPQKDDNLSKMVFEIKSLIRYQEKNNVFLLLFEQEYWIRYYKFNQSTENLLLINSTIRECQKIDKNLRSLDQLNFSSTPTEEILKNSIDIKQIQKRLVMPTIGNISVGKSFFLNSMFSIDFCQVKSEITTKFILFIRHIDNLKEPRLYKIKPFKKDNSYEFFYNCKEVFTGEENIKKKIEEINEENKNSKEPTFYMIEIEIKSIENKEFINKFDFLDVPGLNESGEDYINLYFEYLKDMIKYCLIIFSVENYNSKDSMEVIKKLNQNLYVPIQNFLIILNKIDISNCLEKTIHDFKKVVLNNGSFNIYKNTLVPVNSLELKNEILIKYNLKFYDFINYYFIEYKKSKNEGQYIDFIKKILVEEKKKLQKDEILGLKQKLSNINEDQMKEIIIDFKKLIKEKEDNVDKIIFDFDNKKEVNIIKLFYIFFKEKLLIPKVSNAINNINNYFNNIKNYDFPNKNKDNNNNKKKEYIFDDSSEHKILKDLDKFFEEVFISEKLKNYGNIINILKDDFKILKNYIFNSSLCFIPILGVSNSGKSSFINCLLGKNILPCDSSECTRRAIIIRYLKDKEKTSLYSIKFNSSENFKDIYYYYTKKELISENLEEIKEIISILNESFPSKEEDSFLLLETNIKFLENSEIEDVMKKKDICFIDFPGHNTNNNSFFNSNIYQKVLKMSSFFIYINSGKAFKENSNKMLLSSAYKEVISIRKSDISSKLFIDLCLFIFNKVDTLDEKEKDLKEINKEIKETLEIKDDNDKISCTFFSSKLYKNYLSKKEEYKISKILNLIKQYYDNFKSQENDDLFEDKEGSFIKFVEDSLTRRIKSDYELAEFDLNNINKEKIISSNIYKEINTYLDKFYKENNLEKEEEEKYNNTLQNICKYLILCNKNSTKLNLYKQSYASDTFEKMIEKIIKSHFLKEAEYNNHLERFLTFLNIFFRVGGFDATENNNSFRLIQMSLNNVENFFEDFKGEKIIEKCKNILLQFLKEQKSSFKELMKKNNNDVNKIMEFLDNKMKREMLIFKKLLVEELNKLEKNIGDELSKIGSEMISIDKNVVYSLSTKDKLLVSLSFCTFGVGAVVYGLFYKLPNLIINSVSEERKFQQFLEEIEEKIKIEFKNIKVSIENNIKSYKNIVTKNITRLDGIIKVHNIENDEYWKNAKEKYLIIYNNYISLKSNNNLFD